MVFVTKYRHKVFGSAHLERMEEIMRDVCADFRAELAGFNGEPGHVHLLVNFPPGGAPISVLRQYIEQQDRPS